MPNFTTPLAEKTEKKFASALLRGSCSDKLSSSKPSRQVRHFEDSAVTSFCMEPLLEGLLRSFWEVPKRSSKNFASERFCMEISTPKSRLRSLGPSRKLLLEHLKLLRSRSRSFSIWRLVQRSSIVFALQGKKVKNRHEVSTTIFDTFDNVRTGRKKNSRIVKKSEISRRRP